MRNYVPIFALLFIASFAGCKKDKASKATNITNSQAATMVANALAINSNGFVSIKNDVTLYAKNLGTGTGKGCGVIDSFAVARQEPTTSLIKYNYAFGYHYSVSCDGNIPNSLTSNTIYNGSYDAATLTSVGSTNVLLNITDLAGGTATDYHLTGSYQSTNSFQTIDDVQLSGSDVILIQTEDLTVVRSNRGISGGSATVSITGSVKNKNTFSFNGTLSFNNTGVAKLTLEGTSYNINLTNADVIPL